MTISRIIASWFYMGYLRPSGTIGSLGGLPFAYGLHLLGGAWLLLISAVILAFIGWWVYLPERIGYGQADKRGIGLFKAV